MDIKAHYKLWTLEVGRLQRSVELWTRVNPFPRVPHVHSYEYIRTPGRQRRKRINRDWVILQLQKREVRYRGYPEYRVWLTSMKANPTCGVTMIAFAEWLMENASIYEERGFLTMARRLMQKVEFDRIKSEYEDIKTARQLIRKMKRNM